MKIYLKEKIGDPNLFTGRMKELTFLLNWAERIKIERSKSMAIVSRRKTGKSAILQRLYNMVFEQNGQVVPFYFEIKESPIWIGDFARNFFLTFIQQYIVFKSRNTGYFQEFLNLPTAFTIAKKEGLDHLLKHIEAFEYAEKKVQYEDMWDIAREAPRKISQYNDERVLQIIDEFQFINYHIYWDKELQRRADVLAGSYLHTCEYKNAPMIISGSWVGWLMGDISKMLPGRFLLSELENMSKEDAVKMIYKYSEIEGIPVTQKTACVMAELTEGNPCYISSMFESLCPDKDFTTQEGVLKALDFETFDKKGFIRDIWTEYIGSALKRISKTDAKNIVLYLFKHKDRKVSQKELIKKLNISTENGKFDDRMKALVKSDIINQGISMYFFQAVQDNIFEKVFRGIFHEEIDDFDPQQLSNQYKKLYQKLQGEYNKYKGEFSEYVIINHLKHRAYKENDLFMSMMNNLPDDFKFVEYKSVWSYSASPIYKKDIQVDILAHAENNDYSLIGEVKNRKAKFSLKEAKEFFNKAQEVIDSEKVTNPVLFVFSSSGFFKNTLKYLKDNNFIWSEDERFLE